MPSKDSKLVQTVPMVRHHRLKQMSFDRTFHIQTTKAGLCKIVAVLSVFNNISYFFTISDQERINHRHLTAIVHYTT